jgi:hypothetical protein
MKQRDKKDLLKRISKDEQIKLEGACENISTLKSKIKKEMALHKVIDITKADSNERGESSVGREKINYMIVKARD